MMLTLHRQYDEWRVWARASGRKDKDDAGDAADGAKDTGGLGVDGTRLYRFVE